MKTLRVYVDEVTIGDRFRKTIDEGRVATLAESMRAIGLIQPISVWVEPDENGVNEVYLVAGLHRLRAAQQLGWNEIDAIEVELDALDRRRWEIAENLHRAELTALERDQHVAEWIRLTEEAALQSGQNVQIESKRADGRGHRPESGVSKAARELNLPGKSEEAKRKNAERAVKVSSLTEEAKETAREVGLDDNRSALLRAASKPKEEQAEELRRIAAEKAVARSAKREADREADERRLRRVEVQLGRTDPEPVLEPISVNQDVTPEEIAKIRSLSDFDLTMLISEISDHGWSIARRTLSMMEVAA